MLTSIRGSLAASVSVGVLLSATPALAETIDIPSPVEAAEAAAETTQIAEIAPAETQAIELVSAPATAETLIDPTVDWAAQSAAANRATAPVDEAEASAMGADSPVTFSANIAFATEYRFRGVALTDGNFAVQGGFDVSHSSGFYVGTWGSNLDEDTVGYGSTELDIYGGWSGNLTDAVSVDVGVLGYLYPDAGPGDFDYIEFYGSVGFGIGPASLTAGVAYAPTQDSLGMTDNLYLYADLGFSIPDTPLSVTGHVGYTDGFLTFTNDSEAIDWSIGVDVAVGPANLNASYIGVEGDVLIDPNGTFTDDAFVVTLSASF